MSSVAGDQWMALLATFVALAWLPDEDRENAPTSRRHGAPTLGPSCRRGALSPRCCSGSASSHAPPDRCRWVHWVPADLVRDIPPFCPVAAVFVYQAS